MKLYIFVILLILCGCASVPQDVLHGAKFESEKVVVAKYSVVFPARVIIPSSRGNVAIWLNDVRFGDPADLSSPYGCSDRDIEWYREAIEQRIEVSLAQIEDLHCDLLLHRIADVIDDGRFAAEDGSPGLSIVRREYIVDSGSGYDEGRAYYIGGRMVFCVVDGWMRQ